MKAMTYKRCLTASAYALFLCASLLFPAEPDAALAMVDGTPITDGDLGIRSKVLQLEKQAYDLRRNALESAIRQKLLEKAAAAKNLSPEEFMRQEVDDTIPEPSPQEVEGYYWGQRQRFPQPLEQVRDQVAQMLRAAKAQDRRQAFLGKLRDQSTVTILLEPPRLPVQVSGALRKGSAAAPVMIVEFSDYQCPFCKRSQSTLAELAAHYGDKVSFVFKDLPLPKLHSEAENAAMAARCAGEQGKFWEYHEALFAAPRLQRDSYAEIARTLGLDAAKLQACLDSRKYEAEMRADMNEAASLGIQSTPTFLVNGVLISGAQPASAFRQVIDTELEIAESKSRRAK